MAYRTNLDTRDKTGAIVAVVAVHAVLLLALLNLSGTIDLQETQSALKIFDIAEPPPPAPKPPPPPPERQQSQKPKQKEGASAPKNVKSEATPVEREFPRIQLPVPVPVTTSETPATGTEPTQGASTPGPGTGAGGSGTGTGSGAGGTGPGGGGAGEVVQPPRLLTPTLTGRNFPRELLRSWPRGAAVFTRLRIDPNGYVIECIIDRGTGVPAIDSEICDLIRERFRYRPAYNRAGQPVAGWAGYRQEAPR